MNDLVSVIIPYYKKKIYFKRCIHSILRQTYKKLEVIIIYDDEEQTDLKFINSVIKNQKNIKLIINKKNFGAGKSRNIGIKKSNGKYLAFLDSDDYWKKDKIKTQLLYMKKRNLDFSHTDYIIIDVDDCE